MQAATINFPEPLSQGETLNAFYFDLSVGSSPAPLGITAASAVLSTSSGVPVYVWTPTLSTTETTSRVTCAPVARIITKKWPAGTLSFALALTLATGPTIEPINGSLIMKASPWWKLLW